MRTSSAVLRVGVALAAFGSVLAGAAPAQAATHIVSCESGYGNIACDLEGPAADSVRWSLNGTYIPGWDNKTSVFTSCVVGRSYTFKATVTTAGVVETPVYRAICRWAPA